MNKTKLLLQYCLILNYLIDFFLNLNLQHGDTETNQFFRLLILYMFFSKFDLILFIIFIFVRQNQLTFCHLYLESYFHGEISVTFYTTDAY